MEETQGMKEADQDRGWLRAKGICLVLFILVFAAFAVGSRNLGFSSDDAQFLGGLGKADLSHTLWHTRWYVPGRNLHIIWQRLIYLVGGARPENLCTLHLIQALLDAAATVVLYLLLRALKLAEVYALAAAALFAFYPNHAETHYWLSAGPMNIVSTLFVLPVVIFTFLVRNYLLRGVTFGAVRR